MLLRNILIVVLRITMGSFPSHLRLFLALSLWSLHAATGYDWEEWDYYRILGLQDANAATNATVVKQAYRRQAKEHHPDKTSVDDDKEEATERFRRIAIAYQVLSDPQQKAEYDYFLTQSRPPSRSGGAPTNGASNNAPASGNTNSATSFFSWDTFRDPFKLFEEFFFTQQEEDEDSWYAGTATNDPWEETTATNSDTTINEESWYYHPQYGHVLRVMRHEERNSIYQDYVEDWDPYRGTWAWYPLYVRPKVIPQVSTLQQHQHLVPPAFLRRGRFMAGLFDDTCQFQVRRGVRVIWEAHSGENVYDSLRHMDKGCHMVLFGSTLMLYDAHGRQTWGSPMAPEDAAWRKSYQQGQRPSYYARLDEDGSLTVYRKHLVEPDFIDRVYGVLWKDPKCCYSTNPAGCNRTGRYLVRVFTLNRQLGGILQHLGKAFNRLLDWLEGEVDE